MPAHVPDHDGYDAMVDELAVLPDHERPYRRPSGFPSARAFVAWADDLAHGGSCPSGSPAPLTPGEPVTVRGGDEALSSASSRTVAPSSNDEAPSLARESAS